MTFDQTPNENEPDLMKLWQGNPPPGQVDASQLMHEMTNKLSKFDGLIWWRNAREYFAGAGMIVFFIWKSFGPGPRLVPLAGIAAVAWVMFYLWRSHRNTPRLDPAADVHSYQAALLYRYDHQIGLLKSVKYWYVLPLYLWMLLSILTTAQEAGLRARMVLIVTGFAVFVIWLNEGLAVRKLREKRAAAQALLKEERNEN